MIDMKDIHVIHRDDPQYPELLGFIADPPETLYYRGTITKPRGRILAVVGTRRMSTLGRRACEMLIAPLAQAGYTVVSGLAYGIDTLAHCITLDADGTTIGVMANGLDDESIYPQENRSLVHRIIASGGCVFSEYAPGTGPRKEYFPQRNRIVAGMSHGVLVIEAPKKSGALITAFQALHENREVLAVPGPITHETFYGTNFLIKLGAAVITCAQDVLDVFGDVSEQVGTDGTQEKLSEEERHIYECIATEALHVDDIAQRTNLDIRVIHSTLGVMELKGFVQSMGSGTYLKK